METTFFKCNVCGNVIAKVLDSGVVPFCCDEEMVELVPNTTEGKSEYHLPVIEKVDDRHVCVKVGKEPHPMLENHFIEFVFVETDRGGFIHYFKPGKPAEFVCSCSGCDIKAVYAYCNVHGLWKTVVSQEKACAVRTGCKTERC